MQNVYTDKEIENKWEELEDVPMDEDAEGELVLTEDWFEFPKGMSREKIWHWFDESYSKGIAWLLYKNEKQEKKGYEANRFKK